MPPKAIFKIYYFSYMLSTVKGRGKAICKVFPSFLFYTLFHLISLQELSREFPSLVQLSFHSYPFKVLTKFLGLSSLFLYTNVKYKFQRSFST